MKSSLNLTIEDDHSDPYVFLDIDGVLNNATSAEVFGGMGFTSDPKLDPLCVDLVEKLVWENSACVVISSTWRLSGAQEIKSMFKNRYGWNAPIVGRTPLRRRCAGEEDPSRGQLITRWLHEENKRALSDGQYLIIDDEPIDHAEERVIQTYPKRGFRASEYRKASEKMSRMDARQTA